MKSVFLSMLAIAVLASCSKENEENLSPPGPQGEQVTVKLTIGGNPLESKAEGTANNAGDIDVKNLSIFGVNATGTVVNKMYSATLQDAGQNKKSVEFKTSTQVTAVYVVANTAADLTTGSGALNVTTLKGLKNATASLLSGTDVSQIEGRVLMAGENTSVTITPGTVNNIAVNLKYIGAKIILRSVSRGADSKGAYNTDFNLQHVYLNNVNTKAYFFAEGGSHLAEIQTVGSDRPDMTKELVTGMPSGGSGATITDFAQKFSPQAFAPNAKVDDVGYWFVFENNEALTGTPTTLLIHYGWKENKTDQGFKDMYFPVRFAAGDAFASGTIQPGYAYAVDITLNGDFRSSDDNGSGGGGTPNPDVPVVSTDVTVTVTPVAWNTDVSVSKPFN
ncbi:hypothetical protein [Parabacteroides gordonii]|uniref:hypothetical protein n=1 Tax=Parabacteroides gordonii TaxID=574930 RepID=UPI0026EC3BFA|nr:hypothetical protein [Parabacteroides gordonii]